MAGTIFLVTINHGPNLLLFFLLVAYPAAPKAHNQSNTI
jgi:hypothetical protein